MKTFVIDDDEASRLLFERVIKARGHDVLLFGNAEDALEAFVADGPALLLLDWMLPGMSGLELCRKIRAHPRGRNAYIVIVTARSEPEDLREGLDAGADDYITKPVSASFLDLRISVAERQLQYLIERNRIDDALRESQERYALAARGSNDALWDWNLETDDFYVSDRWLETLGMDKGALRPVPSEWLDRIHEDDVERVRAELDAHIAGDTSFFESEYRIMGGDGRYRWILSRGMVIRDASGHATRIAGSHTDLTRRGVHDALTGLPNRALFIERLSVVIDANRKRGDAPYGLLFIDLDRFKMVNDSFGHHVGDQLLVAVAQVLKECVRPGDQVARFGGDEFVILLEKLYDPTDACKVADRIAAKLAEPLHLDGKEIYASTSVGIVLGESHYKNAQEIIRDADTAMYRAKAIGGNRFRVFEPYMREAAVARMNLAMDLRTAVANDDFTSHYQPIMRLDTGELASFEALARWRHPERGYVAPEEFIPMAEELGVIGELGKKMMQRASMQLVEWIDLYGEALPLTMTVNLSAKQLAEPDLVEWIGSMLKQTRLAPTRLGLEVTESIIIEDFTWASEILTRLKELGVQICMDDFGTGYSSLNYLRQLPVDKLKIDQSFIRQLGKGRESTEIVRSIVDLARKLNIELIA
ncbi:MAG: EAL domain-containing protein, partial [Chrysiogenetes bacterium]|nr:EAL domain-containing protein [Chrysiogenetes bacterium]